MPTAMEAECQCDDRVEIAAARGSPDREDSHGMVTILGAADSVNNEARSELRSGRNGEIGTAYRIPSETSHVSQPRTRSTTKRHMRRMRQD